MTSSKKHISLTVVIFFLFFLGLSECVYSQFIDLRLEIDSELTAQTEQSLDFGTIQTNTGIHAVDLGSMDMGVFSITALENQMLLVTLNHPKYLQHKNPAINDRIPIKLNARYGYQPHNYRDAYPLLSSTQTIKMKPNPELGPWNSVYLFIFGSINVGNIAEGVYSNNIIMEVQYI